MGGNRNRHTSVPRIEHGLCSVSSGLVSNGTKCEAGWLPEVEAGSEVETTGRAVCAGRCVVARESEWSLGRLAGGREKGCDQGGRQPSLQSRFLLWLISP